MRLPSAIHDLSQPLFSNCPQYPDANPRPAQVRLLYTIATNGVTKEIVEASTHTGTHCDAPLHFFEDGPSIDEVPLSAFVAPAVVVDLRALKRGEAITRERLAPYADRIVEGDAVLLNTGGGEMRSNTRGFLTDYSYLSGDGAAYLVELGVSGAGIDAVSMGAYGDAALGAAPHRALLSKGKFIVEDLNFPEAVMDGKRRLFVALPIKLQGCGGAWTRASLWEFD